tara:strand:- start:941 stop:2110 length:1170 start_codon:yes stop_codon:yes gene_type:complete
MNKIGVAGSGRWARVLISILNSILPEEDKIIIFSTRGSKIISNWVTSSNLENRIASVDKYKNIKISNLSALIVANAAKDHFMIAKLGMMSYIPVIVEKPLTTAYETSLQLIDLSNKNNVPLASSQIFLFAEYLNNFKKLIESNKNISNINFTWEDASEETRYGEIKTYDSSLPLHKDCLPHVLSILSFLIGSKIFLDDIEFGKEASSLKVKMHSKDVEFNINLKRNAKVRKRFIHVKGTKSLQLDFTNEPGEITCDENSFLADENWKSRKSPATLMLMSFLKSISVNGILDKRLVPNLDTLKLINKASLVYENKRNSFLKDILISSEVDMNSIEYLLKEILLEKSLIDSDSLMPSINKIKNIILLKEKDIRFSDLINKDIESFVRIHIL